MGDMARQRVLDELAWHCSVPPLFGSLSARLPTATTPTAQAEVAGGFVTPLVSDSRRNGSNAAPSG